jgi:hypothetical protein
MKEEIKKVFFFFAVGIFERAAKLLKLLCALFPVKLIFFLISYLFRYLVVFEEILKYN